MFEVLEFVGHEIKRSSYFTEKVQINARELKCTLENPCVLFCFIYEVR
jgi:hypothetical protein